MRALRVDRDGVAEVDVPNDFLVESDVDWDCVSLGGDHDAWVRDDALFEPGTALARIGGSANVPLPAYVLGVDGERTVGATMSIEELTAQVSLQSGQE